LLGNFLINSVKQKERPMIYLITYNDEDMN